MDDFEYLQTLGVPHVVKTADTLADIQEAASKTNTEPTEQQKETGRYKKGKTDWNGLQLVIENPKGSVRFGKSKDGKAWSTEMKDHYGYFGNKDSGADGDEVDFFFSEEHPDSEIIFVVNQVKKDGSFDEHKCVLGCITEAEAKTAYLRNYSKGWTGLGSIKAMTLPDFKQWLDTEPEKAAHAKQAAETDAEFWARNEEAKEKAKSSVLQHVRDGYIPCPDCQHRYYEMPENETCPKCGGALKMRLRSMKRASLKNVFEDPDPKLLLVKQSADDGHQFTICIDLDGTLAEKEEPFNVKTIGAPRERAVEWVRKFYDNGARIIIFTVRGDKKLVAKWLKDNEVPYDHINENPDQPDESSGKVFADVYWDDKAFNAEDPDEHGPEILRRVTAASGEQDTEENDGQRPSVVITRHTVITISAPDLLCSMSQEPSEDD